MNDNKDIDKKLSDAYNQGRKDLIDEIKSKVSVILKDANGNDLMFDIVYVLKSLK